jgi:diguanylate cyclase (GGDEF)-like protein
LSLLIIDIDHFKAINDRYGHPAGDQVLRELSARVTSAIRSDDVFGRLGGEEFGLILRGNALQGALVLAERIRRRIEKEPFACAGGSIAITVSIGVASHDKGKHGEALVAEADRHLYGAKSSGRNCVQGPS